MVELDLCRAIGTQRWGSAWTLSIVSMKELCPTQHQFCLHLLSLHKLPNHTAIFCNWADKNVKEMAHQEWLRVGKIAFLSAKRDLASIASLASPLFLRDPFYVSTITRYLLSLTCRF